MGDMLHKHISDAPGDVNHQGRADGQANDHMKAVYRFALWTLNGFNGALV